MNNPISKYFSSIEGLGFRTKNAVENAKTTIEALQVITADKALLITIGQSIKYRPQNWVKMAWNSDIYSDYYTDIKDIYPNLSDDCDIFLDVSTRMTLIRDEYRILPLIFLSRNSGAVMFRIVLGTLTLWLITFAEELAQMERDGSWMGADEALPKPEKVTTSGTLPSTATLPGWGVPTMPDVLVAPSEEDAQQLVANQIDPIVFDKAVTQEQLDTSLSSSAFITPPISPDVAQKDFDYDRYPFSPGTAERAFSGDRIISNEEIAQILQGTTD